MTEQQVFLRPQIAPDEESGHEFESETRQHLRPSRQSSDPFRRICGHFHTPKIGHNYVLKRSAGPLHSAKLSLTVGPHWTGTVFTSILTVVATALIIADGWPGQQWFAACCLLFAAATLVTLWITACKDPGIIRNSAGSISDVKICPECDIMVPRNAYHCTDCAVCIDNLDHHCVWMVSLNITSFGILTVHHSKQCFCI